MDWLGVLMDPDYLSCLYLPLRDIQSSSKSINLARRLCTEVLDFDSLQAYVACRLVSLDKRPGVRPIGICEVARRIIGKEILTVIGGDIQQTVGTLQLCAGQAAGIDHLHIS